MKKSLTVKMIENLPPPANGRIEIFDTIVPGLALRVAATGVKSFTLRGRIKGRPQPIRLTLGDARVLGLADARSLGREHLQKMLAGQDPRAAKEEALTFDELVKEWQRLRLSECRPRYRVEAVRSIRHWFAALLPRLADDITKRDAVRAIDKITTASQKRNTMASARACYRWALGRDMVAVNPFAGVALDARAVVRDRAPDAGEVRAIWTAASALGYPWGSFFQVALLSLLRRKEAAGARWSEFDFDKRVWHVPAERMKMGKPHDVHLSQPLLDVLAAIPRTEGCDLVFTTNTRVPIGNFGKAKDMLDAKITEQTGKPLVAWRLHDFRRSGVTRLAAMGFDVIVADKLLAHVPDKLSAVAAAYQKHDFWPKRVAAYDAWAGQVVGLDGDNVRQFRSA